MEFLKKVPQHLRRIGKFTARLRKEDGLINTTDLMVATAATVVLAAGVGGAALNTLDESKYGKAQPDAQAVGQAIVEFYSDTGKWPGQAEHAADDTQIFLLATGPLVGSDETTEYDLPSLANNGLDHAAHTTCGANSGQGFVNAQIAAFEGSADGGNGAFPTGTVVLNLNDFLVRQPATADYPNWDGPYVGEISTDPWDRSWVAYLAPLYCSEQVTAESGAGNLGYAWLISGGTNRTITTAATDSNLDIDGDDTGVTFGKATY